MDILSTLISLIDIGTKVGGLLKGDSTQKSLARIADKVEKLSDNIFYSPNIYIVQHINPNLQQAVDLRETRQLLEPVQRAIGSPIISSALIKTPDKMQIALSKDPWDVLMEITAISNVTQPHTPNMVPILFSHGGVQYIGWQKRGLLPVMFDCQYEDIWKPKGLISCTASMDSGLILHRGGSQIYYYGVIHSLKLTEKDKGKMLNISVDTNGKSVCWIELWRGPFGKNANEWTMTRQHIKRTKQIPNPTLSWQIDPGDYIVFFVSSNASGKPSKEIIKYRISF